MTLSSASGADISVSVATGTICNTGTVEPDTLTAGPTGVPDEHDGESAFTFRVDFSEEDRIGYA